MDTFCREYMPAIPPTEETFDLTDEMMFWASSIGRNTDYSLYLPAFGSMLRMLNTDRARMTGMLT